MPPTEHTDRESFDTGYRMGWTQGVADTGAQLVAVVAAELGHDHPLVDRVVMRLGRLAPPAPPEPPD
jgi:hypothetical protein